MYRQNTVFVIDSGLEMISTVIVIDLYCVNVTITINLFFTSHTLLEQMLSDTFYQSYTK